MLTAQQGNKRSYFTHAALTGLVAFGVYFCMYAFRKPFTVAQFHGLTVMGVDYKVLLIISQVLGYATSKFFGIRIISELQPRRRTRWIIGCIVAAGLTLLAFALVPPPWNILCMYLNGLPLGLIWGLVFSYLEGRQATEIMAAMLSSSFILASGMVKSTGAWLMLNVGVSEFWMPVITGALFFIPFMLLVFLLQRTPPPTPQDIELRSARVPMTRADRKTMFFSMAPGLIVFIGLYMLVTAFRDFRDNFSVEVWAELGVKNDAGVFTRSEAPVTFFILAIFGAFVLVRDNHRAFRGLNWLILTGLATIGLVNLAFQTGLLVSPLYWTVLTGMGLYLAYFPYNSMLFERLLASRRSRGNAGFLIYLADSFGYLGSILVLLYKAFFEAEVSYFRFFIWVGYILSGLGILSVLFTQYYFKRNIQAPYTPN